MTEPLNQAARKDNLEVVQALATGVVPKTENHIDDGKYGIARGGVAIGQHRYKCPR